MTEQTEHSSTTWARLRRNREHNSHLFLQAGQRPENAREVDCRACGAHEIALFWTVTAFDPSGLQLCCPFCDSGTFHYRFAGDRPPRLRLVAAAMGAAILLTTAGAILLIRETPPEDREARREQVLDIYDAGTAKMANAGWSLLAMVPGVDPPPPRPVRQRTAASTRAPRMNPQFVSPPREVVYDDGRPSRFERPAPSTVSSGQPADGSSPETAAESALTSGYSFVASGDRREALDRDGAGIIQSSGEREYRKLLEVVYDPIRNETRVTVDSTSAEWPRRLSLLRGWRRVRA